MIYLDNAATSFPKPDSVINAVQEALIQGGNAGRGQHQQASKANQLIRETRSLLAEFFNAEDPSCMVFCFNATDAINMAIKGFITPGAHVITTALEHNSVLRPLRGLVEREQIELSIVPVGSDGLLDPEAIPPHVQSNTKLLVLSHVSNVLGTVQPIEEITQYCHDHGITVLLDAAQSVGYRPVDVQALGVDMMAFPGHKGLLAPPGCGGLYVHPKIHLQPWREGGTGTQSEVETQPVAMPDRLEAGTHNLPAIAGLAAGIRYIQSQGFNTIQTKITDHVASLIDDLGSIDRVTVFGSPDLSRKTGVVSFNIEGVDCSEVGLILEQSFGIVVRTGLHCAPEVHKAMGTFPQGTVRVSPGIHNSTEDIDTLIEAVKELCKAFS